MTGLNNLTQVINPVAQTIRVTEPGGIVLTAASLYFYSAPAATDPQAAITFELRPVINGVPSSKTFIPGTRVTKTAAEVRAVANTAWNQSGTLPEMKFTFTEPVLIPERSAVALIVYTNATPGHYQLWHASMGAFQWINGVASTVSRVKTQPASGVLYQSSNGTSWTPRQDLDLAYKIYKAKFTHQNSFATFKASAPPIKSLSDNGNIDAPLIFTAGSNQLKVMHENHGYLTGDIVTLSNDTNASNNTVTAASTTAGVFGSSILGNRTITDVDASGYIITMDSNADSSIKAGGNGLLATQQYRFGVMQLNAPTIVPESTTLFATGDFTQFADIMDSDATLTINTKYASTTNMPLETYGMNGFKVPFVIADSNQEQSQLSGNSSMTIKIGMNTTNDNVAPAINATHMSAYLGSAFIDNPDSDNAPFTIGKNKLTTLPFVPETDPKFGSAIAKHVTIPYNLIQKNPAQSIRVLVDAYRPEQSEFDVMYRTCNRDDNDIDEINWNYFSKSPDGPNISNYNDIASGDALREYEFNSFDMDSSFDTYQIKVVFKSQNSALVPSIRNLRTIATV